MIYFVQKANSSNGENSVKRMKLDELQTKSNEKVTPSIVSMFKNSTGCRKNLQLNNGKDDESQELPKSPLVKKHNVISEESKRNSMDRIIDSVVRGELEVGPEKMDTGTTQDKENECITLE